MSYPTSIDYQEAVQHPRTAFADPELQQGRIAETPLGLPLALSGGFALTYPMTTPRRKVAVRCFHRQVPSAEQRYSAIAKKVHSLNGTYFVDFDYQASGIRVKGAPFPIVRMDWADGDTLNVFLDKQYSNRDDLRTLRARFRALALFLEQSGIAHGDIQNGNIIVSGEGIRLIDYDGMYVPGLPLGRGTEVGHKHFQHPDRRPEDYGPQMDRFSFISIDLSLRALMSEASLYKRFREGGETIIFKANDFMDPGNSEIFRILLGKLDLRDATKNFAQICEADISKVPTLEDFLANRNIPTASRPISIAPAKPEPSAVRQNYIAAFDVVDAKDFSAAMRQVGNRVELIGRIEAVKQGVGRRGRGRGRPYIFINFGPWRANIVKITIWSEGLSSMSARPNETWIGKWVSVAGLMDAPYQGKHYAHSYTHVGVTVTGDGQIHFITEAEARYRLESIGQPAPTRNRDIIKSLGLGSIGPIGSGTTKISPPGGLSSVGGGPIKVAAHASRNKDILKTIRSAGAQSSQPSPSRSPTWGSPPTFPLPKAPKAKYRSPLARILRWLWIVGIIVLLVWLARK